MAKPTTKEGLLESACQQFEKLFKLIEEMSEEEQTGDFNFDDTSAAHWNRDKNLKDVLVHLYEWHQLLINWEESNANGTAKPFLPSPYTWKTYGEMNVEFWRKHQNTTFDSH